MAHVLNDGTDPPRPKTITPKTKLHRLAKDGKALCDWRKATVWFAYPDETPTCRRCLVIEASESPSPRCEE